MEQIERKGRIAIINIKQGAVIDAIYYCPHHPDKEVCVDLRYNQDCQCRKPRPGMLLTAIKEFNLDPTQCFLIGDSKRDIEAAKNAGVKAIGVRTGNGVEGVDEEDVVGVFEGVLEGVRGVLTNSFNSKA